jgi:hypothetical protein
VTGRSSIRRRPNTRLSNIARLLSPKPSKKEGRLEMEKWWRLDTGAALFALAAAVFWFLSAFRKLPSMMNYWGDAPASDPFYQAVKLSAKMNTVAAVFSGLSALCVGVKLFIRYARTPLQVKSARSPQPSKRDPQPCCSIPTSNAD